MKLLLLLSVAFGLAAGPAMAGPLGGAVIALVGKIGAGAVMTSALAKLAVGFALNAVGAATQKRKMKSAQSVDVKFEAELGDDTPLTFVVGKFATAGKRKYIGSWGANRRYITEVIEYSSLPQGLSNIWVGDEIGQIHWDQTDTNGSGHDLGHPLENKKDDGFRIWITVYDGTQTAACPLLVGVFGSDPDYPWTAQHIGRGKAYAVITTRYDSDTLTQYPTYLIEPEPLPVYDPRLDSTAGGLGPHRWGNRSTYAPSNNNAVVSYNIARGIYFGSEWVFGGKNLAAWRLPHDEWVAAMNACDATIALSDGGNEPAYRCGAEVSVDMEPLGILEELGRGANMRFAEVGGRLKPLVELPASSVFSITDADIVITEGQSFRPFAPVSEVYNALSATYPEPREKWASKDAPEYVDADGMAADGGRYLPTGLSYSVAPFAEQVQRLMRSQMGEYRRERIHQFTLPPDAYALEPLDMITFTSARNGYVNKRFIVESIARLPAMRVPVVLREVDPADYDWQPSYQRDYTITPPAPVVPFVQGISDFTASAVIVSDSAGRGRRVAIEITCASGEVGVTDVRVQIRKVGGEVLFDLARPYDAPYQWHITDVVPATSYQVRGQLISELTGSRAWSGWITVTTDDLRITQADLDAQLVADLGELHGWIDNGTIDTLTQMANDLTERAIDLEGVAEQSAGRWRQHRDQIRALLSEVVELAARDHTAREEIRQSLTAQLGEMGALFSEQIIALAGVEGASVIRLAQLEARSAELSAQITQADIARVSGDNALSALISALAVGTANQFDHVSIWYWDSSAEGWTGASAPSVISGWLRPAAGSDVISPASLTVDAAAYQQIRARVRRVGAPVWQGFIWWAGLGQAWDVSRRIAVAEPTWAGGEAQITANMPWVGSIDRIRLELVSGTASAYVELDWLAIGRPAPGASSAELLAERSARIAADEALSLDVVALEARLSDAEGELDGQAGAVSSLNSRVGAVEGGLVATAGQVTALDAAINDPVTGLHGLANAIDNLEVVARDGDGSQEYQSTAIRALKSAVKQLAAEAMEGAFAAHLRDQLVREYVATASQSLGTRIDLTDNEVKIVAEALTRLQAAIPDLATADALQALTSTVAAQGGLISAQSDAITALNTTLSNPSSGLPSKASSSALSGLSATVSDQGGVLSALSSALQSLGALSPSGEAWARLQMEAMSGGSGVLSRIGLKALAGNGSDATRSAALFLEALSSGKSRIIMEADQIFMMVAGDRVPLFVVDGDGMRIHSSLLKIYGDMFVSGTITADAIQEESMTVPARNFMPSRLILPSHTEFTTLAEVTINRKGKPVELQAQLTLGTVGFQGFLALEVVRDTYTSVGSWHNASHPNGFPVQVSCRGVDMSVGHGPTTYTLRGIKLDPSINPSAANANLTISNRYLSVTSYIR